MGGRVDVSPPACSSDILDWRDWTWQNIKQYSGVRLRRGKIFGYDLVGMQKRECTTQRVISKVFILRRQQWRSFIPWHGRWHRSSYGTITLSTYLFLCAWSFRSDGHLLSDRDL